MLNKENYKDIATKTIVSAIPFVNSFLVALYENIKSNELEKRLNEWGNLIEYRLSKLEMQIEDLSKKESFVTTLIQATNSAMKTTKEEKRLCLANAVANSATVSIDESILIIYLNLIDRYTEWHLKILAFLDNPKKYYSKENGPICYVTTSISQILNKVYPEIMKNKSLIDLIVKDLYSDSLINNDSIYTMMTASGVLESRTTDLGKSFISFITDNEK